MSLCTTSAESTYDNSDNSDYNNLSITALREKAKLCPLYEKLLNYFSRCHTVEIITLLIQEMFPTAKNMNELSLEISKLSQEDRISKIDFIKEESGKNYKISQGVSNKLKVLFDFKTFIKDFVSSKKRKVEETNNGHITEQRVRRRQKRVLTETTILPIYTENNVKTNYVIQMKENQVHSISFQDPANNYMNVPIPYDIKILNENTFILIENMYLVSKKKNNCINHLIDLTQYDITKSKQYSVTIKNDDEDTIVLQISSAC